MAEETTAAVPLPAVSFLKLPDSGDPYLEGHKCKSCGAVFIGERTVCSKCSARDQIDAVKLSTALRYEFVDDDGNVFDCAGIDGGTPGAPPFVVVVVLAAAVTAVVRALA